MIKLLRNKFNKKCAQLGYEKLKALLKAKNVDLNKWEDILYSQIE